MSEDKKHAPLPISKIINIKIEPDDQEAMDLQKLLSPPFNFLLTKDSLIEGLNLATIYDSQGLSIALCGEDAAKYIISKLNSHYELLEKGKALCAELVDFRNRDGVPHNAIVNAAFQEFRAAIAKAEAK